MRSFALGVVVIATSPVWLTALLAVVVISWVQLIGGADAEKTLTFSLAKWADRRLP